MIINPGLPTQTEIADEPRRPMCSRPARPYDRDCCTCPRHNMYDSGRTGWDPNCSGHGVNGEHS